MTNHSSYRNSNEPMSIGSTGLKDRSQRNLVAKARSRDPRNELEAYAKFGRAKWAGITVFGFRRGRHACGTLTQNERIMK